MAIWTLHAAYDPKKHVWFTLDCDVPGLVTEGETLARLRNRAVAVMPELLADNAAYLPANKREGPHSLRLVAAQRSGNDL